MVAERKNLSDSQDNPFLHWSHAPSLLLSSTNVLMAPCGGHSIAVAKREGSLPSWSSKALIHLLFFQPAHSEQLSSEPFLLLPVELRIFPSTCTLPPPRPAFSCCRQTPAPHPQLKDLLWFSQHIEAVGTDFPQAPASPCPHFPALMSEFSAFPPVTDGLSPSLRPP